MQQNYAESYRELYRNHWWWQSRQQAILDAINNSSLPSLPTNVLDVGCGDGLLFPELQKYGKVEGVESDPNTVPESSPWRDQIHLTAFDLDFSPGKRYGLITFLDVLEHLPDPKTALEHAASLLVPGGLILVTVPAFQQLWTSHDDLNHHFVRFNKSSFQQLAVAASVDIEWQQYLFHWTCLPKLAIRAKEALFGGEPQTPQIPHTVINRICYGLSRFEQLSLSRWHMPFGSSLMAICRAK